MPLHSTIKLCHNNYDVQSHERGKPNLALVLYHVLFLPELSLK